MKEETFDPGSLFDMFSHGFVESNACCDSVIVTRIFGVMRVIFVDYQGHYIKISTAYSIAIVYPLQISIQPKISMLCYNHY